MQAISREKTNVTFMGNPTSEVCSSWRVTPDVDDDHLVIEEPPSPEGPDVTYQLRADNRYSFLVSLPIITSGETPPRINFTTYDVQSAAADTTKGTNNEIKLTGEFIENTTAQGCFIVLQCEYGSPDVFRALLLPDDSSTSVESIIENVISSTYNMFVYDLEDDGLPSTHPAIEQDTTVIVVGNGPFADAESQFLNNSSLYWNGSAVNVRCEFKEDGSTSSIAIGLSVTVSCIIIVILVILAVVTVVLWKKSHKGGYSSSDIVPSCFCSPSPSECSNASGGSGAQLISDYGGTKPKKDGHAEGEAKPPFSGKSSYLRQDSGVSVSTPPVMSKQKGVYTDVDSQHQGKWHFLPMLSGTLSTKGQQNPKIETKTQGTYVDVLPIADYSCDWHATETRRMQTRQHPKDEGPKNSCSPSLLSLVIRKWITAVEMWRKVLTTKVFYKAKSCYHLNGNIPCHVLLIVKLLGSDACVVGLNLSAHSLSPGDTSPSVTEDFNIQQIDGFRQMSVARSEPTSKPTGKMISQYIIVDCAAAVLLAEPQLDSSHPGCGGSYEVVNGVERPMLPFDDQDSENRGAKSTMPNGSSTLPYLNNFTVQGEKEYDKALAESTLTTKGKRHHTFDTPMLAHGAGSICFAEENIGVLPVNNEGEEDSHPDPTGSWRQGSADNSCTVQGDARDMVPEGDEIVPLECSDEAEEQDTVRGLFGRASILPTLPHKDAGKCVCPPLGFEAKEGELVVGGLNENSSLLNPSSVEPSPVAVQAQPEESTSLQSEIQPQESGRSSEPVPRNQGRENDVTKPMECQGL
ncbi:hypothetical protein GBAR_LOCUS30451 [Geodia barretti]|uniref:Uncharacterized protein n=1 Tax=Geodia barretti TaxID=519541 RepID=A0AA35XFS4_GEOBA|nr:hypothetical protein GBAR_LOCUS30451 [Geodia barretti]